MFVYNKKGHAFLHRVNTARFSCGSINVPHCENLHVVHKIFVVNQMHRENLVRKTFMINDQSIASDEIISVGAESHSGMELKITEEATQMAKLKGTHMQIQVTLYCTF